MTGDVRTSKLVEKIHRFLDEGCCVSIKSINLQFVIGEATVHRPIHEDPNIHKICLKFVSRVLSDKQKERTIGDCYELGSLLLIQEYLSL